MNKTHPDIRILWITPRSPLGRPDGARHATLSLLRHLTPLQIGIDLVCLLAAGEKVNKAAAQEELNLLSCSTISRNPSLFWRLPSLGTPFTFRTFSAPNVRMAFKERMAALFKTLAPSQKVFVVFDGLHPFAVLSQPDLEAVSRQCQGIVYRAHNVETTLWEQCAQKSRTPWFRLFFRHQAALVRSFERNVAQQVSLVAPVSEDDAVEFRHLAPRTLVHVTPIGMDFPAEETLEPIPESGKFELLFIGRLDWIPNRSGLAWFLENIWPRLVIKRQNMSLKIAGIGDSRWLQRFRNQAGIEFLGPVDDVEPLYDSCALSIAPLFQGSGTRVKIIESARYGRPVVTTALGAEGSGLVPGASYFQAEDQEEWLSQLGTIAREDCQRVGVMAYRSLRDHFDGKRVAEQFAQVLAGSGI